MASININNELIPTGTAIKPASISAGWGFPSTGANAVAAPGGWTQRKNNIVRAEKATAEVAAQTVSEM